MGFPRQEYWSGLPFPPPGDLPHPGIEHVAPALELPPGSPPYSFFNHGDIWSLRPFPVLSEGCRDPLEKRMAIHSIILAWEIPWTEESGGLQLMGSQRVRYDLATKQQLYVK